jgi:hypothetical protein
MPKVKLHAKPNPKQKLHVQIALGAVPKKPLSQGINKKTVPNYKR